MRGELFHANVFRRSGCEAVDCGSADQAGAHGEGDGVSTVICAESSEQSAGVCFHGVHGQEQVTADFPIGLSAADSTKDLQFSFGGWVGPHIAGRRETGGRLVSEGLMWWLCRSGFWDGRHWSQLLSLFRAVRHSVCRRSRR